MFPGRDSYICSDCSGICSIFSYKVTLLFFSSSLLHDILKWGSGGGRQQEKKWTVKHGAVCLCQWLNRKWWSQIWKGKKERVTEWEWEIERGWLCHASGVWALFLWRHENREHTMVLHGRQPWKHSWTHPPLNPAAQHHAVMTHTHTHTRVVKLLMTEFKSVFSLTSKCIPKIPQAPSSGSSPESS